MDFLGSKEIATVTLFDVRISEGEMQFLADTLNYILQGKTDEELFEIYKLNEVSLMESPEETREFIEDRYNEFMKLIKMHCRTDILPERVKSWQIIK